MPSALLPIETDVRVSPSSGLQKAATAPWKRPFWKPTPGKAGIFSYLVAIHALVIAGLILFPLPSFPVLIATLVLTSLGGFGTSICYHRLLAHRSLKLNKVIEHFLIFCAMFNGSGSPLSWVGYHRQHHARADTADDISSPSHGGFWWAHIRWLYQSAPANEQKWCRDLNRPGYRFWSRMELPVILLSIFCGLCFGWQAFFWMGPIRLVYSLHMQCFVNSITHIGHAEEGDSSRNLWWLGPFQLTAWGENWHRNHHTSAGSARLGIQWWQVDIGWYCICALEAVGLARDVKRPVRRNTKRSLGK